MLLNLFFPILDWTGKMVGRQQKLHLGIGQKAGQKFCGPPLRQGWGRGATKTGGSVLKFSKESAQEGPGARKVPESGKISKTVPRNWPKSWANILRTTVAAGVGRRRYENGGFGNEIFRRIRQERFRSPPKNPKLKS